MKTSFYFVLWILIYPILELINNSFINNHSFIFALAAVWGISWVLEHLMPKTLAYNRLSQVVPILEDIYTENISGFRKRLLKNAIIEMVGAVYFFITTILIVLDVLADGNAWVALVAFSFFTFKTVSRCVKMLKAHSLLNSNPTIEQCMQIADKVYDLNYEAYCESHVGLSSQEMLEPRPKYYIVFQIFSTVVAIAASLLGILFILIGAMGLLFESSFEAGTTAGMCFLYGSLATYFGIKDIFTARVPQRYNSIK